MTAWCAFRCTADASPAEKRCLDATQHTAQKQHHCCSCPSLGAAGQGWKPQQTISAYAAAALAQGLTVILVCRLGCCFEMEPFIESDHLRLAAAAPAEEKKEEQTEFDVKLDGFDAAAKIKVIKEVRGVLPELGLKEAKELVSSFLKLCSSNALMSSAATQWFAYLKLLHCIWLQVEKSPAVLKKGMKKEDAEALKKKLEAGELQC